MMLAFMWLGIEVFDAGGADTLYFSPFATSNFQIEYSHYFVDFALKTLVYNMLVDLCTYVHFFTIKYWIWKIILKNKIDFFLFYKIKKKRKCRNIFCRNNFLEIFIVIFFFNFLESSKSCAVPSFCLDQNLNFANSDGKGGEMPKEFFVCNIYYHQRISK